MSRIANLSRLESEDVAAKIHDQVYDAVSQALIQGQIPPLKSVSLRHLAQSLGVSPMPVREAVRRLIGEKALELQPSNNRLRVPELSKDRLTQLMKARIWVESELCHMAISRLTKNERPILVKRLKDDDEKLMIALKSGDVDLYMSANYDFHFSIYRTANADLLYNMARTLWLQSGPFMRFVFNQLGVVHLPKDHHQDLIMAFERNLADAGQKSMAADIAEGMNLLLGALNIDDHGVN